MDTICIIIMSSLAGACLLGGGWVCLCSNTNKNRVIPIPGFVTITKEYYEKLKKGTKDNLPSYSEANPEDIEPPQYNNIINTEPIS